MIPEFNEKNQLFLIWNSWFFSLNSGISRLEQLLSKWLQRSKRTITDWKLIYAQSFLA
ncbi:hypothetical protein FD12_GL001490 [Lentilactobacillus rapi DSM 19907 = JCM 15042]|uniref:Transposase n=1 Tax=Lentilactobacillus rapi DSM 19907 = JCM 15042 TaxID=1423795 RepID=A0ABR5PFU7_9LACO|nr:hypothetical protein FD12_GL001490 [Lentilactobacillus rapi DSM 19907 = JCM 15042]